MTGIETILLIGGATLFFSRVLSKPKPRTSYAPGETGPQFRDELAPGSYETKAGNSLIARLPRAASMVRSTTLGGVFEGTVENLLDRVPSNLWRIEVDDSSEPGGQARLSFEHEGDVVAEYRVTVVGAYQSGDIPSGFPDR